MKTICENCKLKGDCSYLKRGMERDCIDVQTWEDGWDAAVDKACKWLYKNCSGTTEYQMAFGGRIVPHNEFVEQFRKAMEEYGND